MRKDQDSIDARVAVKNLPTDEKIKYYIGYYKIHAIVVLICVIGLGLLIRTQLNRKESILYFGVLNNASYSEEILVDDLCSYLNAGEKETITVLTELVTKPEMDLESGSMLSLYIAAKELDIIFCDKEGADYLGKSGACLDPEDYLTASSKSTWNHRIVELDASETDEKQYAIDLSESKAFEKLGLSEDNCYMVVICNSERLTEIAQFCDYMCVMEQN